MASFLSQVFESTSGTLTFLHSTATKVHSAAQTGAITRTSDKLETAHTLLMVALVVSLACMLLIVVSFVHDAYMAHVRSRPSNPYSFRSETTIPEVQTRNLKGNR